MGPTYPSFTPKYHHDEYPAIDPTQAALDCSQKVVFITGAGSGIGEAIAIAFAKAHAQGVVLLGRTQSTLDHTAEKVKAASDGRTKTLVTVADVTDQTQVQAAMELAIQHFGDRVPDVSSSLADTPLVHDIVLISRRFWSIVRAA